MKHRILDMFSAISILAAVALICLWVRSQWVEDSFYFRVGRNYQVCSKKGKIGIGRPFSGNSKAFFYDSSPTVANEFQWTPLTFDRWTFVKLGVRRSEPCLLDSRLVFRARALRVSGIQNLPSDSTAEQNRHRHVSNMWI